MIMESKMRGSTRYTHCKCEVPTKYKTRIAKLLNEIMKQYYIKGKNKEMEDAFKSIFKSNLYWAIDDLIVEIRDAKCVEEGK